MDSLKNYIITFSGLNLGKHEFTFHVTQAFFDLFEAEQEISNCKVSVHVLLEKHSTFLEFVISIDGDLELTCDISNDPYTEPIKNKIKVLVKFGEVYDDSSDEIITIPSNESEFNLSQLIYEGIILSVPMKKISPKVLNSEEYYNLLEKFSPTNKEEEEVKDSDPRWDALKKLKN